MTHATLQHVFINNKQKCRVNLLLAIGFVPFLLTACSTSQTQPFIKAVNFSSIQVNIPTDAGTNQGALAMRVGVDAIAVGDAKAANNAFNAALSSDMNNPGLHVANALAYQVRARAGEPALFNLAETGYLVALEQQHDFQSAALQLTHLYFEHKRYTKAQQTAAYALKLDSTSIEALYLLASSSYHIGDAELALWAIEQAYSLDPNNRLVARLVPIIYASAGLTDEATYFINEKQHILKPLTSDKLQQRVVQWKRAYELVNATTGQSPNTSIADGMVNPNSEFSSNNNMSPTDDLGPSDYAWFDCSQELAGRGNDNRSDSSSEPGDETMSMPSLPSPCKGRSLPRMANIDVVILRTNKFNTSTKGINLLQNLAITLQQITNTNESSGGGTERVSSTNLSRDVGLGTSSGSAITYSLNIANATQQQTEVIARPSLMVLDRQPAQFFSGSNVAIGLAGDNGTASSLEHVNIGISLSVTPTFVSDTEMLLNVKAARSFFEPIEGSSTFSQSLQTSRNMVSAATRIKINETLVLSGLTENEKIIGSTGVPILKDIPGLNYLFSKRIVQDFNKTVHILITPRRAMTSDQTLEQITQTQVAEKTEPKLVRQTRALARSSLAKEWPNFIRNTQHMNHQERAFSVRSKDMQLDDWERPDRIQRILQDAVNAL
jgi:tetratricopeptide (TPR) repeat protein